MTDLESRVAELHRAHYRRLVAPLIRILGSFEAAEDVVQDAFARALLRWETDGVPNEPVAWLSTVARNRALDVLRKHRRWTDRAEQLTAEAELTSAPAEEAPSVPDDTLRLIFTCCHPSLSQEAQIGLTLRTVCGLTSDEVARAFLLKRETLQQRLVRARRKIDAARIPYVVPEPDELAPRLQPVMRTVYLVFNEGYKASEGTSLMRRELGDEAIRLGRLLTRLVPEEAAPKGLLALMLLHHCRRHARIDAAGDLVRLDEQDRSQWDRDLIEEALPLVDAGLLGRPSSTYAVEAAIAALHARAPTADATDWPQIAALYGVLLPLTGHNPVVALNGAVATALAGDLDAGLQRLDALEASGRLAGYHLLPAARGYLLRKAGRLDPARAAFRRALELASNDVERRHLARQLNDF